MLTIRLFGAAQFSIDGREIQVPRRKSRALIYYLAAHEQPVQRQQLLALFWADLPRPAALQTLRTTLHGLRGLLGPELDVASDIVALAGTSWVDVREFERRLELDVDDATALGHHLELYRGDLLEGFSLTGAQAFEDWLTVAREHYRRLAVRGWTALATSFEAQNDFRQALESLDRALALNPLQEDLQREVIRLLYLAGDRPGAIRRYDELRRLLDEEMGVPPMVETRALYDAILTDRLAPPVIRALPPHRKIRPQPISAQAKATDELPFTGRSTEMAALQQLMQSYSVVLIEGETGVGKTRLAQEALPNLAELSLVGRCRELEQSLPYHPVIEALRHLMAQPDWPTMQADLRRKVPGIWLAEVGRLVPEFSSALGAQATSRPAEEARLWEGIRQFLAALAGSRPIVFFIDDLHWADAASLGLLGYLARQAGEVSIRVLATLRPAAPRVPVEALLQALTRENRLARLPLARLSFDDIQAIARLLSDTSAPALADWLFRYTEGNAYFLVEVIRHARQSQQISPHGALDFGALSAEVIVPQTIYSLIQSRLRNLSGGARRVLDAAVAQGREFDFEVVARAAGMSENAALDALDELMAGGLVIPIEGRKLRFDHPLTMEVAYRDVGELRHRLLHRRVAEAMESLYQDHTREFAGQIAWQFSEGEAPQRAVRYALLAGAQAANVAAWSEAGGFYELALRGLSGAERLPALQGLAETFSKSGNYPRACEVLRDALDLAEASGLEGAQIDQLRLSLARNLMPQARFAEVIELADQVRNTDRAESAATAELLWGTALSLGGAELEDAIKHLRTAELLWRQNRSTDFSSISQTEFELGNVLAQKGDIAQAVAFYRQALATATQARPDDTLEQRILALNNLAYHLSLLEDPTAKEYAQTGLKLAQEKGVLGLQAYLYSTLGEISLAAGELMEAEALFREGLSLAQRFSIQERMAGLTANLGLVAVRRGETALAIHHLSNALGKADALGTRHLAIQVRIWLAPLLPPEQAHQLLAQARLMAQESGRARLIVEIGQIEEALRLHSD